jgi:protein involved in polysaccharide export with SLBB domain
MKTYNIRVVCGLLVLAAMVGCARQRPVAPVPLPVLSAFADESVHSAGYRLKPGDTIRVKFLYHPELDVRLPVRPDGDITLQEAGEMQAAGLTAEQLADVIRKKTSDRLRDPDVTVIVAELGEQKVYVGGEVRNPGFVQYRPGMTPLQAILDRGGFTGTARPDSVVYVAVHGDNYLATKIDLTKVLKGEGEAVRLAGNDILYVPRNTIGDVDAFVRLYIQAFLPIPPRVGVGFNPAP